MAHSADNAGEAPGKRALDWSGQVDMDALVRQALAGRVACELAHEINNLLVGVLSVAEDARGANTFHELRQALATNAKCGQQIAELVNAFQSAFSSRQTNGGPVDLAAVVERSFRLCRKKIERQRIRLEFEYGSLPRVQADAGGLEQVFIELSHNALRAMPNGGVLKVTVDESVEYLTVTISCAKAETTPASVSQVSAPANLSKIGDGGCGGPDDSGCKRAVADLGMAVAQATVRRFGGELTTESPLGSDSRFVVRLRVWREGHEC